ncbi:MAG: hypothetical protein QXR73_03690 [Candidatus Micrarchaeaceae archaeon]
MDAKYVLLAGLFIFLIFTATAHAQLGEEAGEPFFNISVGSSATFNYSILNSGSTPIHYTVILPSLNTIPHNVTPTVTVTPMNGTLAPNSQQVMTIAVSMPASDKPYLKWQGVLSVVSTAPIVNVTSGAGAVIKEGVAKIVTIESEPPKPTPLVYYVVGAIVAVLVIVGALYFVRAKKISKLKAANMGKTLKPKATNKRNAQKRKVTNKRRASKHETSNKNRTPKPKVTNKKRASKRKATNKRKKSKPTKA